MSTSMDKLAQAMQRVMDNTDRRKTKPYDVEGEVVRVEGDTAYVHFPGGVDSTPVLMTINASPGDRVQVRVANGTAFMLGNYSAPPTDDYLARLANLEAIAAGKNANKAKVVADGADTKATGAKRTAEAILVYDHTYELNQAKTVATFTAYLYRGGIDVKEYFDPELFTWYLKTEDNEEPSFIGYGYTCTVNIASCDYGAEVVGYFTNTGDALALSSDDSNLTNQNGEDYSVRASGDSIRVRDLTKTTTIYPTDHVMIITAEDEKLASIATLSDAVDKHYTHIQGVPSATWRVTHNLRKNPSITVVDSAGREVIGQYDYIDVNTVELTFVGAFSGKAFFN